MANASRSAAEWLFAHSKIERPHKFRVVVSQFLRSTFDDAVTQGVLVGKSNKPHKFDNVVVFPRGRRLIVDSVVRDPQSINARVIANLDVKKMEYADLDQRIIYDDQDEVWSAADLNLLGVGATAVPFSKAPAVLSRLAASAR